jgi:hypothetical protein
MGLLAMKLLAVGARILLWLVILVPFLCLPCNLEHWNFLRLHVRGLHSSLDDLLSELTPYANLVYAELVSLPIIPWR